MRNLILIFLLFSGSAKAQQEALTSKGLVLIPEVSMMRAARNVYLHPTEDTLRVYMAVYHHGKVDDPNKVIWATRSVKCNHKPTYKEFGDFLTVLHKKDPDARGKTLVIKSVTLDQRTKLEDIAEQIK